MRPLITASLLSLLAAAPAGLFAEAYGSLNNFDCVNDNETECHGFEIEVEDADSTDITYTYNYNHYGAPRIYNDTSNPAHPKVYVRYESAKNPDGTWAAYTAVPSSPLSPTNGHQFTNPNVNIGGEHFGVGFHRAIGNVSYHWLVDDGFGNLVRGTAVSVATPTFTYVPNPGGGGQVQAEIEAPPEPHVLEFGKAVWVKDIKTVSHSNQHVDIEDLVSDDPDDDNDHNWTNGEPDEVETEWRIMQREFSKVDGGANADLLGEPQEIGDGDEVVTRRYEFFEYVGPLDDESGEAKCENVGPDDIHGEGTKIINGVEVDLSTVVVVGDYIGAQMAGFDVGAQLGLLDVLQEGDMEEAYVDRRLVIAGTPPITTELDGLLPEGMEFDPVEGILSGTPSTAGTFSFSLHSTDAAGADILREYNLVIRGGALPAAIEDWRIF